MTFPEYLSTQQKLIDAELDRVVPPESAHPEIIHRAVRYSLFAGGKRVRPVLCLEAARTVADGVESAVTAACALELIHTYSLIHDDLPALDNDDYRRGRLTCHKKFGEAMAILAGDALLTRAFEVLGALDAPADRKTRMVLELAQASGTVNGMIGGQVDDLLGEGQEPTPQLLDTIHRAKTGALLCASLRMGAIYAGASEAQLDALTCYGLHIGLAFQIVDDILDVTQSSEELGKTAGKDAAQHKITFPAVYGLDESHRMAGEECAHAHHALGMFAERAGRLHDIADLIITRSK